MLTPDAVVESLAAAARDEGIAAGVSNGCLTVPDVATAFELCQLAAQSGWGVVGNTLHCSHGELEFLVPVIIQN